MNFSARLSYIKIKTLFFSGTEEYITQEILSSVLNGESPSLIQNTEADFVIESSKYLSEHMNNYNIESREEISSELNDISNKNDKAKINKSKSLSLLLKKRVFCY